MNFHLNISILALEIMVRFRSLFYFITMIFPTLVWGQYQRIENFIVKENLTANGKIALIAVDSLENVNEHINGTFKFSINSFEQSLTFHDGVAVPSHPIDGSTFALFKHKNQHNSISKLYFLYKTDKEITPVKINGLLLLIIPGIILLIAYMFKRFLTTFVILALIYVYFSSTKGLSLMQILENTYHTIKAFF